MSAPRRPCAWRLLEREAPVQHGPTPTPRLGICPVLGAQWRGGVPDTVRSSIIEAEPTLCSGVDLLVEVEGTRILHRDSPNLTLYVIYTSVQMGAHQRAHESINPHVQHWLRYFMFIEFYHFWKPYVDKWKNKITLPTPWYAKSYLLISVGWLICRLIVWIP